MPAGEQSIFRSRVCADRPAQRTLRWRRTSLERLLLRPIFAHLSIAALCCVLMLGAAGQYEPATSQTASSAPAAISPDLAYPVDLTGLHNVVAYAPTVYSGSAPEDPAGFEQLARMGIRTIISVDGAVPLVDAARAHGLRYVHLPIGYDGVERRRAIEIGLAIRELPHPVYVHCHHGKHRSAAALAAALVASGRLVPESATQRMRVSGTSPEYRGLYQSVAAMTVASANELAAASREFPEVWKTSGLVQAMVEIDDVFDRLRKIERAGWTTPPDHPDLVPAAEAGRLADLFRTLRGEPACKQKGQTFLDALAVSTQLATELEDQIVNRAGRPEGRGNAEAARPAGEPRSTELRNRRLSTQLKHVGNDCKSCHNAHRD